MTLASTPRPVPIDRDGAIRTNARHVHQKGNIRLFVPDPQTHQTETDGCSGIVEAGQDGRPRRLDRGAGQRSGPTPRRASFARRRQATPGWQVLNACGGCWL